MLIKNVPELFYDPEESDTFVFDKNGRLVYIYQTYKEIPKLFVYDLMFNSVVKLNAGSSIISFKNEVFNFSGDRFEICEPITTDKLLFAFYKSFYYGDHIILGIIHLNFEEKTYELLSSLSLDNHQDPLIVFDNENLNRFGLFCNTTIGERGDNERLAYTLQMFHLNESLNKITKENYLKEFEYMQSNSQYPDFPHLFKGKLWFVRRKHAVKLPIPPRYRYVEPPPSPTEKHKYISYFDLNGVGEKLKENIVEVIKGDEIKYLKYYENMMIFHVTERDFRAFNLETHEWTKIESTVNFYDFHEQHDDWSKWTSYMPCGENGGRLPIDKNFVVTAVKNDEKSVYRVPLRSPLKLLDLTWTEALNNNFVNKISCVPFERVS